MQRLMNHLCFINTQLLGESLRRVAGDTRCAIDVAIAEGDLVTGFRSRHDILHALNWISLRYLNWAFLSMCEVWCRRRHRTRHIPCLGGAPSLFLFGGVEIIRPLLHHLCPWNQIFRIVVGSTHFVTVLMSELQFNVLVALLVQDRRRDAPKPVSGHAGVVTHSIDGKQERVVTNGLARIAVTGEKEFAVSCELA